MASKRYDNKGRLLKEGESQRKDGRYQYRYKDITGKNICVYATRLSPSDPKKGDTKPSLRELEEEIKKKLIQGLPTNDMTVKELVELYLNTRSVTPGTVKNYKFYANWLARTYIWEMKATNVSTADILKVVKELKEHGLAVSTINNIKSVILSPAFQFAVQERIVATNPANVKLSGLLGQKTKKKKSLTMAEQEKLLSFLYNDTKYRRWYHDVNILLHTGMRIGEYCGLCVEDIHLDERYINISKQLNYNTSQLSPTKSQAGNRQIPIAEEIIPSLEYIIDRAEAMGNIQPTLNYNGREYTNFINCTSKGNIRTGKIWDTTFKRIREANRDDIYIYPHLLRHTFCSNMATAGMSPKILQKIMGHEKIEMTLNVYAEVNDTTAVLSELDAAMSNLKK